MCQNRTSGCHALRRCVCPRQIPHAQGPRRGITHRWHSRLPWDTASPCRKGNPLPRHAYLPLHMLTHYIYTFFFIYIYTHTQTYIYIYIYNFFSYIISAATSWRYWLSFSGTGSAAAGTGAVGRGPSWVSPAPAQGSGAGGLSPCWRGSGPPADPVPDTPIVASCSRCTAAGAAGGTRGMVGWGRRGPGCSPPSPDRAQLQGAPMSLGTSSSSLCPAAWPGLPQRSPCWGLKGDICSTLLPVSKGSTGHPWGTHGTPTVHLRCIRVCVHGASMCAQGASTVPPRHVRGAIPSPTRAAPPPPARPSQPAQTHPPAPYESLHESKSALNQIIPNNNDINYAFNTFYCFPPFPSRHICVNNIQKIYGFLP